ncbi:MAG TPA: V-type ATP synthase subunit A [Acidimicrobiales bacterium]|nr:V-type ATP synthase subunit A [Acidimicrobiales bacterium]
MSAAPVRKDRRSAPAGTVVRVNGPLVEVTGLDGVALFDTLELGPDRIPGEAVAIGGGVVTTQAYEYTGGLRPGDRAAALGAPLSASLGPGLLGGVFDGLLRPLEGAPAWLAPGTLTGGAPRSWRWLPAPGRPPGSRVGRGTVLGTVPAAGAVEHRVLVPPGVEGVLQMLAPAGPLEAGRPVAVVGGTPVGLATRWPVRRPRPAGERLDTGEPLVTGQRVLDLLYPVPLGGAAMVPGGFGTGKTVLLQQLAKWCAADVIVYVACGERGNELVDATAELAALEDPRTGGRLMERTVIVANTSNMPVMAREASIYTGMTVAEYYRDMGHHAVVIADSTSRWAEALREFSSRSGELPAEEGYPAGLASALAAFYERAGLVRTSGGRPGSVTVVASVSPPGGDMTEPVTAQSQRFVRCLWSLDRDLAYARHYPAVSWSQSFCRDAPAVGAWHAARGRAGWSGARARIEALLAEADRLASVAELVGRAALPGRERMVLLAGRLIREGLLRQSASSANDAYCSAGKQEALADAVLAVHDRTLELVDAGVDAGAIEQLDFSPLLRAAEEVGSDDADGVSELGGKQLAALDSLRGPL